MLTKNQIETIITVMKPYNPTKIGIFGSFARGENTDKSDIDILYRFENPVGIFKLVDLKNLLEGQLQKKIDLVSEKYVHPLLKDLILKDLQIIYEKN